MEITELKRFSYILLAALVSSASPASPSETNSDVCDNHAIMAKYDISSWFTIADIGRDGPWLRIRALDTNGTYLVEIASNGRVTRCTQKWTAQIKLLDESICAHLARRARFNSIDQTDCVRMALFDIRVFFDANAAGTEIDFTQVAPN